MLKTNFIDVIKTFTKEEMKRFADFANSPYHNSNKSVIKLVGEVKKYYPDFENRNFSKKKIYAKVYGTGKYNDQVMRNLLSDSLQITFSFLSLETGTEDKAATLLNLLKGLRNKKLDSLYDKNFKIAKKIINNKHSLNFNYFEYLYQIESENFLNEINHNRQESVYPVVVKQSEYATYSYITKLINQLIDMSINEKYYKTTNPSIFAKEIFSNINIESVLEHLGKASPSEYAVLSLFYYRAMTSLRGNEEDFQKFKGLFLENAGLFNRSTNYSLITSLDAYCINNFKRDSAKYRLELFGLHNKAIELGLLVLEENEYLHLLKFWNIFINSVELQKDDWAEEFAEKYHKDLDPEIMDSAVNFARAIILYKRKDYDGALEKLNDAKLNQYLFKLSIRSFYLRIYYEKGDFQSAAFALDSYKQFLYKNKTISENYRSAYLNFASVYYDLLRASSGEKPYGGKEIEERIESFSTDLNNKPWLQQMASLLK